MRSRSRAEMDGASLFGKGRGMSIGRRLIDLARAELNSLLDKAARTDDEDEDYGEPAPGAARRRPA